jgi:hypothetical protein
VNPDPGFKKNLFGSKNANYLSLGLLKGRPNYKRNLLHSKENIQLFQK